MRTPWLRSARWRLTLSYAGFLTVAGVALAALVFYIVRFVPADTSDLFVDGYVPNRRDLLNALWPRVWQVMSGLLVVGLAGGWVLAGWMLRPLHKINTVARRVGSGSFDARVRLGGRPDEFRELADTMDSMLDRLEASIQEERRFAANASHELRTPLAITGSLLEVAVADPAGRDVDVLLARLGQTNRRGTEIVESLLALASLEQGQAPELVPVDITELAAEVVAEARAAAQEVGVKLTASLGEGDVDGSVPLLRQLLVNLVANAVRHNVARQGWVEVATLSSDHGVEVVVANSGPHVSAELLPTLTEPFVRGGGRVTSAPGTAGGSGGRGLGLALALRIAQVHGARLHLRAREAGGLEVRVRFPV